MTGGMALFGFGFGNLAMLGWLAAAAAPLLIHLWSRRKYREMSWAAVEFLLAAIRKQSRRIRIEQWILLAMRTALILCLVLALAEPFLERTVLPLAGGVRTHKVLILDGSYSMAYKPTDKTRFDRAKELATQIVDESRQGDGFTIVLMGSPPREVIRSPAFERGRVVEEIENLKLPHGGGNLPATLVQIEQILDAARREYPKLAEAQVFFLTDLGQTSWSPEFDGAEAQLEFRRRCEALTKAANVVVIDLGQEASENLVVTGLRAVEPFATVAGEVRFEAELRSFGRQARSQQLVEFWVDGRRVGEGKADLAAGGRALVPFSYRFDAAGDHAVEARLAPDLLDVDNHRYLSLPVKESLSVLCVNGKPTDTNLGGATEFLALALAPMTADGQQAVRPQVVPENALLELDLNQYDAVFLANVGQFTAREAKVLDAYLQAGGGLVFFLGDRVQAERYNQELAGDGPSGMRLLPARLGEVVRENQYAFDPLEYQHPLLKEFRGRTQGGLVTRAPLVETYFRLQLSEGTGARVALAFEGGDPAIVEETIHRGRSILVATSADASWTTMPLWPSYLPIVQELLAWSLGGQLEDRNLQVGDLLGAQVRSTASRLSILVRPPAGDPQRIEPVVEEGGGRWTFADTSQSGIYQADLGAPLSRTQTYALNVDTVESDLTRIDPEQLPADFYHRTTWQDLDARPDAVLSPRGGLHLALLYTCLGLLLAEPLAAWYFGRHRS